MVHVSLADRPEFLAGDHTILRELLHPAKQPLSLGYSVAHGIVAPGARSKWHRLASSEVYYIIAGRGRLTVDDSVVAVGPGSVIYVPPGGKQSLENFGLTPIEFLCLVDPAWRAEDEEVLE
ncbi:MAG TPA: cupin domain-containing protein [Nitrospiraceae bacterium]|nr:cupin domain-containing protein [Nitrospiraceae bacterium]